MGPLFTLMIFQSNSKFYENFHYYGKKKNGLIRIFTLWACARFWCDLTDTMKNVNKCTWTKFKMQLKSCQWDRSEARGHFKKAYELLNLRALKFSPVHKCTFCNVWVRYFVWNFKGYLWNSTKNILPICWKMQFLYNADILRDLRFKRT